MPADLTTTLGPLRLANPVVVAAGTFGYGPEFRRAARLESLGGLVTKTITRQPRAGNPPPRVIETPAGMLNSVGLQIVGLDEFLRDKLPALARLRPPVIVSILGESPEDAAAMAGRLNDAPGVAALELNLSCPNLQPTAHSPQRAERQGVPQHLVAQDAEATFEMVAAVRKQTTKALIAKLTPDVTDPVPIAQAAERAGADALAVGNTFTGMSLDPRTRRSRLGALTGGLSGPAIRPLALYRVWRIHQAVRCPIIGIGGILTAEDAVEFFLAGASAIAVGTATFRDPAAATKLVSGLTRYLERHGLRAITELIGALQSHAVSG